MKSSIKLLIPSLLLNACSQTQSNAYSKSSSAEPNAKLFFDGTEFSVVFEEKNEGKNTKVSPTIEQLAVDSEYKLDSVESNTGVDIFSDEAKALFNIKIADSQLNCSVEKVEIKNEMPLVCAGSGTSTPQPSSTPSPSPEASTGNKLVTTQTTFIKISNKQSTDLSDSEKCSVSANIQITGQLIQTQFSHHEIILDRDIVDCTIGKKGAKVFVFTGHSQSVP